MEIFLLLVIFRRNRVTKSRKIMKGVPPDYSRLSRKGWRGEGGGVRKRKGKKNEFRFSLCACGAHMASKLNICEFRIAASSLLAAQIRTPSNERKTLNPGPSFVLFPSRLRRP